jgi:hypothetical protein
MVKMMLIWTTRLRDTSLVSYHAEIRLSDHLLEAFGVETSRRGS